MIPFQYTMLTLWGAFALVGLARRFPRELGATIGFVGMLLMFDLVGDFVGNIAFKMTSALAFDWTEALVTWLVMTAIVIATVTAVYVGETLSFPGEWPPNRLAGSFIDMTIGLVNGWLVVGTWWYYTNKLEYPQQAIGLYVPPLDAMAQRMVQLTPLALIPEAQATWIITAMLLALLALRFIR
jgi:hypothetical protein